MHREGVFNVYDVADRITDNSDNSELFQVSNPINSFRGKHVITHVDGDELAKIKKKLLSIHPIWHLNGGAKLESRLATLVFDSSVFNINLEKKAHVYQYCHPYPNEDDDTKYEHLSPSLLILSDQTGHNFKVFGASGKDVFATVTKSHRGNDMLVEAEHYTVTVQEGVDVLFMISIALMYEFALSDLVSSRE